MAGLKCLLPTSERDLLVLVVAEGLVPLRGGWLYRRVVALHAAGSVFCRTICEGGVWLGVMRGEGPALTSFLVERFLRAPLKPCQIRIFSSLGVRGAIWLLGLALFPLRVFIAPLNLFRFFAVSFCDGCFSCSSDGALLCVATRRESPLAYR